ncbi:MAG: hypothetical protein IJ272_10135, partial [Clostridia bacterium]|nr:hypothetical protein [Clostridia bacterium]
ASNKSNFILANTTANTVPVLTAIYTNSPKIGQLSISCDVDDAYKKTYTDYTNKEFKYEIKYSKVFGGDSKETLYNGKCIVTNSDGTSKEITIDKGILTLTPGQKALIKGISVKTKFKASAIVDDTFKLKQIRTTSQFTCDNKNNSAFGSINTYSNIIEFTATSTSSKEETVIVQIPDNNTPESDPSDELQDVSKNINNTKNNTQMDESPKTADNSLFNTYLLYAAIAFIVAMTTLLIGISKRRH